MIATHTNPTAQDMLTGLGLVIPHGLSVRAAANLLKSAGASAAPVVDGDGRCIGLFSLADYRRWVSRNRKETVIVSDWQLVHDAADRDAVGRHMTRRYAAATPTADLDELAHRLRETPSPCVVLLDRQRRPLGVVRERDIRAAARRHHPEPAYTGATA
jgi:CBS domain-containing protein